MLTVTLGFNQCDIRCDNTCQWCEMYKETINYVLFEGLSSMKTSMLSTIPLILECFPTSLVFTNLDFLFWNIPSNVNKQGMSNCFSWIYGSYGKVELRRSNSYVIEWEFWINLSLMSFEMILMNLVN